MKEMLTRPIPLVLLGAFMISFSAVWVKIADLPPTTSAFYRVFLGGLFLCIPTLLSGKRYKFSVKEVCLIAFCGLSFAADLFFWHRAIIYIGPGLATIIGNFQVFILAAIGIVFWGERFKRKFFLSIPLAILGLFLLVGIGWAEFSIDYKIGLIYSVLVAVSYSAFILILRNLQSGDKPFYVTLMLISFATALFLLPCFPIEGLGFGVGGVQSFLCLIGLGLLSQAIGWSIIASAMPKIPATLVGLILLLQPSLSFVWDILFFNRPTDIFGFIGFVLTISAIYLGVSSKINKA